MNDNEKRICDACEEEFQRDEVHYCSCGALVCWDCYAEDRHAEHDVEEPLV